MKILFVLFDKIEILGELKSYLETYLKAEVLTCTRNYPAAEEREEQLKADDFIAPVSTAKTLHNCDYALGITEKDLYSGNLNFVFGLASMMRKAAVISVARLRSDDYPKFFLERTIKETIHEIGHLLGLQHCNHKECVMHLSNNMFDTDMKDKKYCELCRQVALGIRGGTAD